MSRLVILDVIEDWKLIYAYFPKKTITGKWIWLKPIYQRRVIYKNNIALEFFEMYSREYEYGTIFDVLANNS